jgi:hypothetical protein
MTIGRLTMPGALAALALLLAQDAWGADNWCYRKLGDSSGNSCGAAVAPLDYCLRGALIVGGACSRQQAYAGQSDEQARSQRPRQRAKARDRGDW